MKITENKYTLEIGQEAIPFSLVQGKPNRVRLFFSDDNRLCIETGSGRLGNFERDFLVSKSKWILRGYRNRMEDHERKTELLDNLHRRIPLFGKDTAIEYIPDEKTWFRYKKPGPFRLYAPEQYLPGHKKTLLYHALRKFAESYLQTRVNHWTAECELTFNRLRIKDLKSKWGSCSSKRNINLNWQLVLLEETLIDYVIVHELMHLREMNHSPAFWSWVGKYYPDYKQARKQLKEKQWLVGILK